MSEKISRRKLGAIALGVAAAVPALSKPSANGQAAAAKDADIDVVIAGDMASLEKKLAKPLSEEAKKLTLAQLKNNKDALKDRYKFDLPENSEPCFIYPPVRAASTATRGRKSR